jgi:hypothetical protein
MADSAHSVAGGIWRTNCWVLQIGGSSNQMLPNLMNIRLSSARSVTFAEANRASLPWVVRNPHPKVTLFHGCTVALTRRADRLHVRARLKAGRRVGSAGERFFSRGVCVARVPIFSSNIASKVGPVADG